MYWSPDGKYAIVVAEEYKRLDFRDAVSMKLAYSIPTPRCAGINHADFSIDGRFALFTCEFNGSLTKIDLVDRKVLGTIKLSPYFNRPEALAAIDKSAGSRARFPIQASSAPKSVLRPACRRTCARHPMASCSTWPT